MTIFYASVAVLAILCGAVVFHWCRRLRWLLAVVVALAIIVGAILLRPAWTPRIDTPNSVASLEAVTLNGSRQWILVRGDNRNDPVLLFLHGGPGMPAMYLAHASTRLLEKDFVVIHWDRRDAGKSFNPNMPPDQERVSAQLADAEALVRLLRERFGTRPMFLVGHSWGTYLGMLLIKRHPDWFAAYVGMGQVTDPAKERAVADRFIHDEAVRRGNKEALVEMRKDPNAYSEKWLFQFGGELHHSTSFLPLLLTGFMAPEYTLHDALNVAKGPNYAARYMKYDVISKPLSEVVTTVDVPAFLFAGRYDYVTPSVLGVAYFKKLEAPCKKVFWFENSAHFPFYEEPKHFAEAMQDVRNLPCVADRMRQ